MRFINPKVLTKSCPPPHTHSPLPSSPIPELKSNAPSSWAESIKGMMTTATFLKYLDKENRDKAFDKFCEANPAPTGGGGGGGGGGGRPNISSLIEMAKLSFPEPIVKVKEIVGDLDAARYREIMDKLRGVANDTSARSLLPKIFAEWMKMSLGKAAVDDAGTERFGGAAMTPRHVQSIAYFVVSEWIRGAVEERRLSPGSPCRSLMGTMGTGEGKSLVFAMLACYAVKVLKMKVHILANTLSLKHRCVLRSAPYAMRAPPQTARPYLFLSPL